MKVLLVEDDERIVDFLVRGLKGEGYSIQVAKDGSVGLAMASHGEWDVIILDLMLPIMDGREVCQTLRRAKNNTPILMLTALETTDDVVRGLRMGANDYMTKPFAFDELVARLQVLARSGHRPITEDTNVLEIGDIRFDRNALEVTKAGKHIDLTALEYALLEFLMVEAGKVVSRVRILQNVWGSQDDPLTNVVDVYIRRLRTKVFGTDDHCPIKTIRGRGYRFDRSEAAPAQTGR